MRSGCAPSWSSWWPPSRGTGERFAGQARPHDFPGLDRAAGRLVRDGLAVPGMTNLPVGLTAAGRLADYLTLVARDRLQTSVWVRYSGAADPPGPGQRQVRRVTALRSVPVAVVERMTVPAGADPARSLPVRIVVTSPERVADELAGLAFEDRPDGVTCDLVGPDGLAADVGSRLVRVAGSATGTLHWRRRTLLGRVRPSAEPVLRERYREHVLTRLSAAEPPSRP